jgi:hypothetical protein
VAAAYVSQIAFAEHVRSWPNRLWVSTASGNFRASIRKDPHHNC